MISLIVISVVMITITLTELWTLKNSVRVIFISCFVIILEYLPSDDIRLKRSFEVIGNDIVAIDKINSVSRYGVTNIFTYSYSDTTVLHTLKDGL